MAGKVYDRSSAVDILWMSLIFWVIVWLFHLVRFLLRKLVKSFVWCMIFHEAYHMDYDQENFQTGRFKTGVRCDKCKRYW